MIKRNLHNNCREKHNPSDFPPPLTTIIMGEFPGIHIDGRSSASIPANMIYALGTMLPHKPAAIYIDSTGKFFKMAAKIIGYASSQRMSGHTGTLQSVPNPGFIGFIFV